MKNLSSVFIATIICLFIYNNKLNAAHIVGGDVRYDCLGLDTLGNGDINIRLLIEFDMYRDNGGSGLGGGPGAGFDVPANFGVYRLSGGNVTHLTTVSQNFSINEEVEFDDSNPCISFPPAVGVDRALYSFELTLPLLTGADDTYMVAYQRCCRNATIDNLVGPGETGAVFSIEITSLAMSICNTSPVFNNFPPVVICSGEDVNFDHSASDVEGHQVFYEFCSPLSSGGTDGATTPGDPDGCTGVTPAPNMCLPPYDEVIFQLPTYSATNPLAGNPQIVIDPITGLISGIPTINGQFVVGVCAREIFNGQIMTVVRRDFQFNVATCTPNVVADIEPELPATVGDINGIPTIITCGQNLIPFEHVGSTDNVLSYYWEFDVNGTLQTANTQSTTFEFPGPGSYNVLLVTNQGLTCEARDSFPVLIYPELYADFNFEYDTCRASSVMFMDSSFTDAVNITNLEWDFNGEGTSNSINPSHLFNAPGNLPVTLIATDNNGCQDTITQIVPWFPAPPIIVVNPSSFIGCAPADIFFDNLSTPIDTTYDITWDFGDGEFGEEISPTHQYNEVGSYTVSLEIVSPLGCSIDTIYPNLIQIEPKPIADFTFTPEMPNVFNMVVDFFDNSTGAIGWQWAFGDGTPGNIENPTHEYRDTGMYDIQLIVRHPSGCTDTIVKTIDIEPIVTYHMPNAFTPNGDGTNDIFKGNGYFEGMQDFNFTIWNRWGELIFESTDPFVGWNGTKNNSGENAPGGVYVYEVSYVDPRGQEKSLRGHATLLR